MGIKIANSLLVPIAAGAEISEAKKVDESIRVPISGWALEGVLIDPDLRRRISGVIAVAADGTVIGLGEFSFIRRAKGLGRLDAIADGFDLYFRTPVEDCSSIRLYGVDDAASIFVPLAEWRHCPATEI